MLISSCKCLINRLVLLLRKLVSLILNLDPQKSRHKYSKDLKFKYIHKSRHRPLNLKDDVWIAKKIGSNSLLYVFHTHMKLYKVNHRRVHFDKYPAYSSCMDTWSNHSICNLSKYNMQQVVTPQKNQI